MNYHSLLFTFLLFVVQSISFSQDSTLLNRDFVFNEGIFVSLQDVRLNSPISPDKIGWLYSNLNLDTPAFRNGDRYIRNSVIQREVANGIDFDDNNHDYAGKGVAYKITWDELKTFKSNHSIIIYGFEYECNDSMILIPADSFVAASINDRFYIRDGSRTRTILLNANTVIDKKFEEDYNQIQFNLSDCIGLDKERDLFKIKHYRFGKVYHKGSISLLTVESTGGAFFDSDGYRTNAASNMNNPNGSYKYPIFKEKPIYQLMLNLKTGSVKTLSKENVEDLLADDIELYGLFKKDKKRKERLPYYVKLYNNKYPFYL